MRTAQLNTRRTTTKIVRKESVVTKMYLVRVTMPDFERKEVQVGETSEREAKEAALDLWGHIQPDLSKYVIVKDVNAFCHG
jgi:hypothetical protein